jgi:NAD(P)-dependent dehydrogenase (short-subunit alcohol dehydrogenase family)
MSESRPARVAIVTGASAGVGKATALLLVAQGWRVIGVGRNPGRCVAAERELRAAATPRGGTVDFLRGDFALMSAVRRVAGEIAALTTRIDVLINNAGGVRDRLVMTDEGIEATFAANHLAPFLLTRELLPLLRATAAGGPRGSVRVIAVSSRAHEFCPGIAWDDLQMLKNFRAAGAYGQSKLANLLYTRELARRVAADGIVAQAMHPGVVDSNFASHGDATLQAHMQAATLVSPERPARTLVWMCTAPAAGLNGGRYFHDCAEASTAPAAQDDAAAARLWRESEALLARLGYASNAGQ